MEIIGFEVRKGWAEAMKRRGFVFMQDMEGGDRSLQSMLWRKRTVRHAMAMRWNSTMIIFAWRGDRFGQRTRKAGDA
jgi:hypothetical protein